jgi:hypothetical protein
MLGSVDFTQTGVGTPLYFSPEICKGEKYNFKTDMWMLGCLLYELCMLKRPFVSESINNLIDKIINTDPQEINERYSPELRALVTNLLTKNSEVRWGVREIYKNDTFLKYLNKYSKPASFKLLDINKLKINIEEDNNTPVNNPYNRPMNFKKLTPSYCKSDIHKIIKNLRMSPRLSPMGNRKLEITEDNLSYLNDKLVPTRRISTYSMSSTTATSDIVAGVPKSRAMKLNAKSHYKHISINISSCQSPDNKATYVETIEKIEEIEFPKSQFKIPTPTNTRPKKNSFELKDIPRSTKVKSNKRYDNNIIKQFLIDKYGLDKYTRMYNSILENNNKLNEEMIKDIVGEDYSDALNYAKYMTEYDNI